MLYDGAVQGHHHENTCEEYAAPHSLGTGGQLADCLGITASGQKRDRIELRKGLCAQELRPEHIGDHSVSEAPWEIEELSQQHAPGSDGIEDQIDVHASPVHGHQEHRKGRHDDDPIGMRYAGSEKNGVGYKAYIDSPFRELLLRLRTEEIAEGHQEPKADDGIINLSEHHICVIGDGIQECQIAKICSVKHIGDMEFRTGSGAGNENAAEQDRGHCQYGIYDDLSNVLLTQKEEWKKDQEGKELQRDGQHETQHKALCILFKPAGHAGNGEIQGRNIVGTQHDHGSHEDIGCIEQNADDQRHLFREANRTGKAVQGCSKQDRKD